jgi:hypothetical protein
MRGDSVPHVGGGLNRPVRARPGLGTQEVRVDVVGVDPAVVEQDERETSELLSRLIQIDTSNPCGNENAVAEPVG